MAWSVEAELLKGVPSAPSIEHALVALGVIPPGAQLVSLTTVRDWWRGGAETYVYSFDVEYSEGCRRLIFKCAIESVSGTLTEELARWLARRSHVSGAGIATPRLFGSWDATLLEERQPFEFWPHAEDIEGELLESYLGSYVSLMTTLASLGYRPMGMSDLMSDGSKAVMVDFGWDLGEATANSHALDYADFVRRGIPSGCSPDLRRRVEQLITI